MNTDIYKQKLLEEQTKLEAELATVGQKNPANQNDWEGKPEVVEIDRADEEEVADKIEGYETNTAIVKQLETRLLEVTTALGKIDTGTFGTCTVCGKEIEADRLEANPAAMTCKLHM